VAASALGVATFEVRPARGGPLRDPAGRPYHQSAPRPYRFTPVTVGIGPASFSFGQFEGFTTRLLLFDTPGGTIVIDVVDVAASPGTMEDYLAVIDSIEFSVR
jgi:hypothetical protein